jgi:hypothetical protein
LTSPGEPERLTLKQAEAELEKFPAPVMERFRRAQGQLSGRLAEETIGEWASEGLEIARKTVRSWEAAAEFFDASPAVQKQLPSGQFLRWARTGAALCGDSPSLAVAYFKASPATMLRLRPRYIDDWASVCRALYRGTWKSSALSCRLYEATPRLLEAVSFEEFCRFGAFLEALSRRSYDLAGECLTASLDLFPRLGSDVDAFVALGTNLTETSWREVKGLFEVGGPALADTAQPHRAALIALARRLVTANLTDVGPVIKDGQLSVVRVPADFRDHFMQMADGLARIAPTCAPEFLKTAPAVLERVTFPQLREWHATGSELARENTDAAAAFFRLESGRSSEVLDALSSSIELTRVRDVLRMYCRALAGRDVEVQASQQLVDKNIGWVEGDTPTTEGTTIFLPGVVNKHPSKTDNFSWFKVISTHQVCHIEFGSFDFDFDRPSTMFKDLRPKLPQGRKGSSTEALQEKQKGGESGQEKRGIETAFLTDMSRFFDLFPEHKLALDIFTVVEDARLDTRVMHEYRGIARAYSATQGASLADRPQIESLPAREALVEFMVRLSLGQKKDLVAPADHMDTARKLRRLMRRVSVPAATVEDASEATVRAYALISQVKNDELDEDEFESVDEGEESEQPEDSGKEDFDEDQVMQQFMQGMQQGESGEEQQTEEGEQGESYDSPQDVDYRGEFKPELGQLLSQLQMGEGEGDGEGFQQITPDQLKEMMKNAAELEVEQTDQKNQQQMQEMLDNLMKELARREPQNQPYSQGPIVHVDEEGGPLDATEPDTFVYDEWDFRANEYKPRWCLVHEKAMADGEPTFYRETLSNYASLVRQIRRQFELVVPEMYRKVKRLEDGEEFDLDAAIEAIVDLRSGSTPSEKLFWRRNKTERSVAVAFLLDMSASTAEAIDEAKRGSDDWGAPDDPVEYMVWLRSRRAEGLRRAYKRIVDVEKEGIVLLVNALETLGDTYGIYGFSGYGRENVEFYVIKDLEEHFSPDIPRRIDRIAPLHATRMGPAIRHAAAKLAAQDARSRFMFLISDGRPQDRGYSREGVEKEYAVHDTRMALVEAKDQGITPFCLTVDKAGHDYLKTMMQDFSYEVLPDINLLPQRLPQLYRRLTM